MRLTPARLIFGALLLTCLPGVLLLAQKRGKSPVRRAQTPEFQQATNNVFYADLFGEGSPLSGERPANAGAAAVAPPTSNGGGGGTAPASSAGGVFAWTKVISAATIEDEIKALKLELDKDVTRPSSFTGGGNRKCRTHFSILAMLFAIVGEYDGDVRWKEFGPAARDIFARVAANCKTNTRTVFDESKKRKDELQDLIGGGGLSAKDGEAAADWSKVADRSPLMKKIDQIMKEKLQPWTANANDFKANSGEIVHQAEIIAAVAEVLTREGMEDAGDEDYDGFSIRMRDASRQIVDAVKLKNDENARKAVGEIMKSCSECHESYRG
ncbi:MAG TPA: hypothetical protein DCY79_21450 [Planctomycetaceae bacterium]|nr:hypothetical protein [Planctomycetaceae bacterium]